MVGASTTESASEEAELLSRAQSGDPEALEQLLKRYEASVYRFSMRMCRNPEDARDVLQETLFAAVRGLEGFRGEARLSSWLFAIARSFCIKKRRKDASENIDLDAAGQLEASGPLPDKLAGDRELLESLDSAVHVLDHDSRAVLLLRDVEGLTASETARSMNMSVPQVKSRLHRARATVRQHMQPVLSQLQPVEGSRKPGCPDVVNMFSKFLEDEIGPDMCARMHDHLEECDYCRTTCDSLKRTVAVCNAVPAPDVPRVVQVALRHEIRQHLSQ